MSRLKKGLALVLTLCMMLSLMPVITPSAKATGSDDFTRVFHLDCGRKYFSVDQIEALIDTLAENNYTHIELAIGNDGLRFLLDDMSVDVDGDGEADYTSADVTAGIQAGNQAYYNAGTYNELTQAEMDTIISYANENGIGIIPLINTPGHMDAILDCMESVGISSPAYSTSSRTVDVTNTAAVNFTLALVNKYIQYFADQGCEFFNMGCDEYANDVSNSGFAGLISSGKYGDFVTYVNKMAAQVKAAKMTPMAFNDGIYYNSNTSGGTFDKDIVIAFWTSGWPSYSPASASFLAEKGHKIISTNDAWYYVLGRAAGNSSGYTIATAQNGVQNTACTDIPGDNDPTAAGCMICLWCDTPSASYSSSEVSNVTGLLQSFAENNPDYFVAPVNETICIDATGVEVNFGSADVGNMTVTVTAVNKLEGKTYVAYDITPDANYKDGDEAVVSIPLSGELEAASADKLTGFGVNDNGDIEYIDGQKDGDSYSFTVSHFSVYGVMLLDDGGTDEDTELEPRTITVTAGGTATDTITGVDYSGSIVKTELDESIATVSAEYQQVTGDPEEVKATSITSGSAYYIKNSSGQYLNSNASWVSDISSAALWTATSSGSGYTLKNGNNYLRYQYTSLSTTTNSRNATTWTFSSGTFKYEGFISNYTLGDAYTVTTTDPVDETVVTFTAATDAAGKTTYVTVGNIRYTINVLAEDLSTVTPVQIEWWITNYPIESTDSNHLADGSYTANSKTTYYTSLKAAAAYGEEGVALSAVVPATGTYEYAGEDGCVFWKGTRLTGTGENVKQTGASGSDSTAVGDEFAYIRYFGSNWAISVDRETWTEISTNDQLVAYYLQATKVTKEVTTMTKDWGLQVGDRDGSDNQVALSVAVVYPDGSLSPAENNIYSTSTLIYNYWSDRDIGIVAPQLNDQYDVEKITVTPGTRVSGKSGIFTTASDDGIVWQKKTINEDGDQWFDETSYWDDSMDTTPMVNGATSNITWGAANSAYLVLIYLKPIHYDTNLIVNWVDDSAGGALISTMEVAVSSDGTPTTFYNGLKQTSALPTEGVGGTFTLDDDAYVTNSSNVNQTFNKTISTVPGVADQYKSGLYQYVSAELSGDGKTLTLHYNIDSSKLSLNYVVDFGLPVMVPLTDIANNATSENTTVSNATTSYGTAKIEGNYLVYTPSKVLTGNDIVTVKAFDQTIRIGFIPATTVYYEEGFATNLGSIKGDGTQTASKAGNKANYGYDVAYTGTSYQAQDGTQLTGTAVFEFTGTGLDIYARSTNQTGTMMIMIKQNGQLKKVLSVDTKMLRGETTATAVPDTAYNVPVASITDLAYGSYSVEMTNVKSGSAGISPVYIDGFRVYGTLANQDNDVYKADLEDNPTFIELRDKVLASLNAKSSDSEQYADQIAKNTLSQVYSTASSTEGAIIVTSPGEGYTDKQLTDLLDNGPKNEIYLQQGQALVFNITTSREVQIGLKALDQTTKYTINSGNEQTLNSSTDMFYTVLAKDANRTAQQTITITNTGSGILSVTKLKVCDDPNATLGTLTADDLIPALVDLGIVEPAEESGGSGSSGGSAGGVGGGGGAAAPVEPSEPTTPPAEDDSLPFADVTAGDWFRDSVKYVYSKGLMNGTSETTFSPLQTTNRAMIVTILHRLENSPAPDGQAPFADVPADQYYANPVAWAAANGIVTGTSETTFSPLNNITREQLAAILYRYAQYKGYDVSVGEDTNILSFTDAETISEYAIPAIQWAVGSGLINGKGDGRLDPQGSATRAEVSAILARFCEAYAG